MVIVDLTGGIGNQLFQYSAGRYLSYIKNTGLSLNLSGFESYKLHKYSLQHFNIQACAITQNDFNPDIFTYEEKSFTFDKHFEDVSSEVLLKGYWQSEKYFSAIEDIIRSDLQLNLPLSGLNRVLADEILSAMSVSIHIRRGDYNSNINTFNYHGICDLDYYERAIQIIGSNIRQPHFFVFSDDPEWATENLKTGFKTTFITHNDADTNFEDLRLMSLCKHHIIANSTFSWWGAWLNNKRTKIVIAPKKWFNNAGSDTTDLIPDQWMSV